MKMTRNLLFVGLFFVGCGFDTSSVEKKTQSLEGCRTNQDCPEGKVCYKDSETKTRFCVGVPTTLRNFPSCEGKITDGDKGMEISRSKLAPFMATFRPSFSEHNNLAMVKLQPNKIDYPFVVRNIRYLLSNNVTGHEYPSAQFCNPQLGHEVYLWKGRSSLISSNPNFDRILSVPEVSRESQVLPPGSPLRSWKELVLKRPLVLQKGEVLFVAIRMKAFSGGNRLCLTACRGKGARFNPFSGEFVSLGNDFWGASTQAPYDWRTLASYEFDGGYMIEAQGGRQNSGQGLRLVSK